MTALAEKISEENVSARPTVRMAYGMTQRLWHGQAVTSLAVVVRSPLFSSAFLAEVQSQRSGGLSLCAAVSMSVGIGEGVRALTQQGAGLDPLFTPKWDRVGLSKGLDLHLVVIANGLTTLSRLGALRTNSFLNAKR